MYRLLLFFVPLLLVGRVAAQDSLLRLDNGTASFELLLREGKLYLTALENREAQIGLTFEPVHALFAWPEGKVVELLSTRRARVGQTAYLPAHTNLHVVQASGGDTLVRDFQLFDGVAALRCRQSLTGAWSGSTPTADDRSVTGVEGQQRTGGDAGAMLNVQLPGRHWRLTTVRFADQTDVHNDLVQRERHLLFNSASKTRGNLLIAERTLDDRRLWLLREAPLNEQQLDDPGYDFSFDFDRLSLAGSRYGWVIGLSRGDRDRVLKDLRRYQLASYRYRPARDEMVLMNTWGDRGQDGKVNETFVLRELEVAAALGITHFQIDDGWQAGLSKNSASSSGDRWNYWETADWQPHPQRFPRGLAPVADRARELGMEIGLWFNASSADDYAAWQRDAEVLTGLYEQYGIRTFKMDGINIYTPTGNRNLRRLLDRVREATKGEVVFNLDATAGRRGGYFYLTEYGNIFLENRYTDWGKYYPHWTLRNVWQLAHYLPPAKLQIEFLNPRRNADQYPDSDPLSPANYDFDYLFAITAVAQPLAWMEGSNLSEQDRRDSVIHQFEPYLEELHTGLTLPIGEEPDGTSWTGFRTEVTDSTGFLLVFREYNERDTAILSTGLASDRRIELQPLIGGEATTGVSGPTGELAFRLPRPRSFALYRYTSL